MATFSHLLVVLCLSMLTCSCLASMPKASSLLTRSPSLRLQSHGFDRTRHAEDYHEHHDGRNCGTVEYNEQIDAQYPERGTAAEFEETMRRLRHERRRGIHKDRQLPFPVTLNVIVHVIYDGEPLGTDTNIADAQVASQITVLNEDFRRANGTPGYGQGVDTLIQFQLYEIKRWDRNAQGWTPPYTMNYINNVIKAATITSPQRFLNLWVIPLSNNLLGYASFPSASGLAGLPQNSQGTTENDGVVINTPNFGNTGYVAFPYDGGRTSTHEVGHFLGLRHIWGDVNGCGGTDYCDDTPPCDSASSGCPAGREACGGLCMYENYMDYSYDSCLNIFTACQAERMQIVLENSPRRTGLIQAPPAMYASDVIATGPEGYYACDPSDPITITINITNLGTQSFDVVSYTLTLAGDVVYSGEKNVSGLAPNETISFESVQPVALYGEYGGEIVLTVTIEALDGHPNGNPYAKEYDVVFYIVANQASSLFEDFSGPDFPPPNWAVPGSLGLQGVPDIIQSDGTAGSVMGVPFYSATRAGEFYSFGYVPGIYVPNADLVLSFAVSYALRLNDSGEEILGEGIDVYIAGLCNQSIVSHVYSKYAGDLATAASTSMSWQPTASSDWRIETVALSDPSLVGQSVTVLFTATGNKGNNMFLDNIQIAPSSTSVASQLEGWATELLH